MKLKQFFTLFLNNKIHAFGLIVAFFGAFYLIPVRFDDEGFNEYLCGVSAESYTINKKRLTEVEESVRICVNENPKYKKWGIASKKIGGLEDKATTFANKLLTELASMKSLAAIDIKKAQTATKKLRDSALYSIYFEDKGNFNAKMMLISTEIAINETPSQLKLNLNRLREINVLITRILVDYCMDKEFGSIDRPVLDRARLGVIPKTMVLKIGKKFEGTVIVGTYFPIHTNIQLKANNLPINVKDGVAHYAKKENSLGEKQFIVSAFIKNWENDNVTEQRDTFYYEVIP